jgi:hypothetical protein
MTRGQRLVARGWDYCESLDPRMGKNRVYAAIAIRVAVPAVDRLDRIVYGGRGR